MSIYSTRDLKSGHHGDAYTDVLRLRSDLSLSTLRRRESEDECRRLRQQTSTLKSDSDVNRLKVVAASRISSSRASFHPYSFFFISKPTIIRKSQ